MITLEIKDYVATEKDEFWLWKPEDPKDVKLDIDLYIGPTGEDHSHMFSFTLLTLKRVEVSLEKQSVFNCRSCWIVKEFNWPEIEKEITEFINKFEFASWKEASNALSRYFSWEYEGIAETD